MPRLDPLPLKTEDESVRSVFEDFIRERGNVPNLFRTYARRLEMMTTSFDHFRKVMYTGSIPVAEKEIAAIRTSQINGCRYCLASHLALAKKFGVTKDKLQRLCLWEANPETTKSIGAAAPSIESVLGDEKDTVWNARERIILLIADTLTRTSFLPTKLWDEACGEFHPEEVMEIIAVVCLFNYYNRFSNALEIEITK
jgi:AhpD family alkylhydroperoxidase